MQALDPSRAVGSQNFVHAWEPRPFRSWPAHRTRLERLAFRYGIDDEELRELLRAEFERRREGGRA